MPTLKRHPRSCEATGDMVRASEAPPLAAPPGVDGDGRGANRVVA